MELALGIAGVIVGAIVLICRAAARAHRDALDSYFSGYGR
jgi:hypothetical protein